MLNEAYCTGDVAVVSQERAALYYHVDDGLLLSAYQAGQQTQLCDKLMEEGADALESAGFVVPTSERQSHTQVDRILGFVLQRSPARFLPRGEKAAMLLLALKWIREPPWV